MEIFLQLSIVLAVGIVGGKLAKFVKLPSVSGYLVAGVFLGPSFSNLVTKGNLESFTIISELALAFIAFSIGSEFVAKEMKKYGKKVLIITFGEVIGAIGLVFTVMYFLITPYFINTILPDHRFAFSIVIASMSAATAPAATLLVMRQYRADGPVTKTLLAVVALDDVYGIMAFGICIALAKMSLDKVAPSFQSLVLEPLIEIFGSFLIGFIIGLIMTYIVKKINDRDELQVISLIAIGLGMGIAKFGSANGVNLSPLLINIVIGTTIVNFLPRPKKVFESVNDFVTPFFVLFFTLAGASLDLAVLASVGVAGVVYIFSRGFGKMLGSYISAKMVKAEDTVVKYMGLGLLPQGGISIGLSVIVRQVVGPKAPEVADAIITIIMSSVLVYETTGPIFAKIAIAKAGEINGLDRKFSHESVA